MRKEIFTLEHFKTSLTQIFTESLLVIILSLLTLLASSAQCPLACDKDVQVSLDENCKAAITPDIMLEDMGTGCPYDVVVYNINNLPLPDDTVRAAQMGQTLKVAVFLNGNQCWGTILVEDKYPPRIDCPDPITVYCNETNYSIPAPLVSDNCGGAVYQKLISDVVTEFDCNENFAGLRTITYYYEDVKGNKSDTCAQLVYFRKIDSAAIVWPLDIIYGCSKLDTVPSPKSAGYPTVNGQPIYPKWSICKIAVTYEDQVIPICAHSFKVLRKWTYVDWCLPSGRNIFTHFQVIKVIDDEAPDVLCPSDVTFSTDAWSCTGTTVIAPPHIVQECSDNVKIEVGYKPYLSPTPPVFEGSSIAGVVKLSNGFYSISGLPLGFTWVIFRITDDCGNHRDCPVRVFIEDKVAPVTVCDQKTIVSLSIDTLTKVEAFTFDDRSHDNCGIARFEAKRMDDGVPCLPQYKNGHLWSEYVYFCCEDYGKTLMVNLRVWDQAGNSNTCMVQVEVQDKLPPILKAPACVTISCEYDYTNYDDFGKVVKDISMRQPIKINDKYASYCNPNLDGYVYDGCEVTIKVTNTPNLLCGQGTITRKFEATDANGNTATDYQIITVKDFTPGNVKVTFPADITFSTTCLTKEELTPDRTGKPRIDSADRCNNMMTTNDDVTYVAQQDACVKIIRSWTVIDWCIYDPHNPKTEGIWKGIQVIKLINLTPPDFTERCLDRSFDVIGPGCQGQVNFIYNAKDDCTDSANLKWYHIVDINNDGTVDPLFTGPGNNLSGIYPVGVHKVTISVSDACSNENRCSFLMTVRDAKKPTPYCLSSITTTVMPSTESIAIWAKDYNLNSEDNCTPKNKLKYYFLVNQVFVDSMLFDCSHIGKNTVRIYVKDEAGNFDFCETVIEIQDPNGVCQTGLSIQGKVTTTSHNGVNNTKMIWERSNPISSNSSTTNSLGLYTFQNISSGKDYAVRAEKTGDFLNGVTTHDIVVIQKHILGIKEFDSPYQMIAADASNNGLVTASDISAIRKIILGVSKDYPNGQASWRFVPVSYVFPDPKNPFPFVEKINFIGISLNQTAADFYGIKIGDLTGNADASNFGNHPEQRTAETLDLELMMNSSHANSELSFPVMSMAKQVISGFQMAIQIDPAKYEFLGLNSGELTMSDETYHYADGVLRISYIAPGTVELNKGEKAFSLILRSIGSQFNQAYGIALSKSEIGAEAYNESGELMNLNLMIRNSDKSANKYQLMQNRPNPFADETNVEFLIPTPQEVEFVVYGANGKVVFKSAQMFKEGSNVIHLTKQDFGGEGVFYIQMNTNEYTETKKMVLIR